MLRTARPARPLPPPVRTVGVSRAFVIDFNKLNHFYDWSEAECATEKARLRRDPAAMADVPRLARVLRALELVARHYGWTETERAEWRVPLRQPGAARDYIAGLALALQHGYRQHPGNQYQRLAAWLAAHGFEPPDTRGEP